MAIGDFGKESFRDAIVTFRNVHILAALSRLFDFRSEVVHSDDMQMRSGINTPAQRHFLKLLDVCDKFRRHVTYNPDSKDLKDKMAEMIDATKKLDGAENPFGGDDAQMGAVGMSTLLWDITGGDVKIPMISQLRIASHGILLVGAIDRAIVAWTRIESRHSSMFITPEDSMRIGGMYQQVMAILVSFGGDDNSVDFATVPADQEPRGAENAVNRVTETAGQIGGSGS